MICNTQLSEKFMSMLTEHNVIVDWTDDGMVLSPDFGDWICLEDILWYVLNDFNYEEETYNA